MTDWCNVCDMPIEIENDESKDRHEGAPYHAQLARIFERLDSAKAREETLPEGAEEVGQW